MTGPGTSPSESDPSVLATTDSTPPKSMGQQLFESPDVQAALADVIREIPALLKQKWSVEHTLEGSQARWAMVWTAVIVAIVVVAVGVLVTIGKISSDSTTFILGAVVGYAFAFLRDWFSPKD